MALTGDQKMWLTKAVYSTSSIRQNMTSSCMTHAIHNRPNNIQPRQARPSTRTIAVGFGSQHSQAITYPRFAEPYTKHKKKPPTLGPRFASIEKPLFRTTQTQISSRHKKILDKSLHTCVLRGTLAACTLSGFATSPDDFALLLRRRWCRNLAGVALQR